jgi:hypothetical protein
MFEPKLTDPHPESAKTHAQKVHCSLNNRDEDVIIANWPFCEEDWSDWRVIECSLLPLRAVHCGMDCLSQSHLPKQE